MSTATKLLKPREVSACKQLAESELSDNKRAAALLAIHQGQTQAQAAITSGLTVGQVKYIVTRFRRLGMNALATSVKENPVKSIDSAGESTVSKTKKNKAKSDKKDKKDKKAKKNKEKNKDKDKKTKKDKKKNKKKNKNKK